jgi:hypothetical protein
MSKIKLDAARELIQEKQYDAARAVLRTIDHPQATTWLAKLNQIAPEADLAVPPARRSPLVPIALGVLSIAVVALIGVVIVLIGATRNTPPAIPTAAALAAAAVATVTSTSPPTPSQTATNAPTHTPLKPSNTPTSAPTATVRCMFTKEEGTAIETFLDTAKTAGATSRIAVSQIVLDLQKQYRAFQRLDHPVCLKAATSKTEEGMGDIVDAFQEFSAENDFIAGFELDRAHKAFKQANDEYFKAGTFAPDYRLINVNGIIFGRKEPADETPTAIPEPTRTAMPAGSSQHQGS